MDQEIVRLASAAPGRAPLSPAVTALGFVFVSGCVPTDPETRQLVGQDDVAEQTRQVLRNADQVLRSAGSSLTRVVKTTVFLTNMTDFSKMNDAYRTFFGTETPARSTVQVVALARPQFLVEIELIAVVQSVEHGTPRP